MSKSNLELRIGTNWGGERVFTNMEEVQKFIVRASETVADISQIILQTYPREDETFLALMSVNNDISYQLQGACALLAADERASE